MDMNRIIAENLQALRTAQNLSIGQLAERTGLSKAVLSQLERGGANPTINTILKISGALHVPYSALLEPSSVRVKKISRSELAMQPDEGGHYRIGCYYPGTAERKFEWYLLEFDPGCAHSSCGHGEHTEEYVLVKSGALSIEVGGERYELQEGDSLSFDASLDHTYRNESDKLTEAYCVNYYP